MTTELNREALLPCPFCESSHITDRYVRDGRQMFCVSCGASVAPTYHGPIDTLARARAAWNRRALPTPDAGEVGELVAEMRAGLEGVTPGPWQGRDVRGMNVPSSCVDYGIVSLVAGREVSRVWSEADALFGSLCSPDNIAKLLDHVSAQASRIKELEAGDVQRVKDIFRLTVERDTARDLLEQAKAGWGDLRRTLSTLNTIKKGDGDVE